MKPTPRETAAVQRLAEAVLDFIVAVDEGHAARRTLRPRDEIAVRVQQAVPPPLPTPPAPPPPASPPAAPPPPDDRLLLKVGEAARLLSVSPRMIWRLAARGQIPIVRVGSASRIPAAALEALSNPPREKSRRESRS